MRYAQILPFEVCNGEGIGCSLFVQGCHFHCAGCFNQEAWDFNGGNEWNDDIKEKFFEIIKKPYIKRVSILGGEPLANENVQSVYNLIKEIKENFPEKKIWLYTGYTITTFDDLRKQVLSVCDVVVDGKYIKHLSDITLKFRGSKNQTIWKKENDIWKN